MPLIDNFSKAQKNEPNGNNLRPSINQAKTTYTKQISGLNSAAGNNQYTRISDSQTNSRVLNQNPPAAGTLPGSK